MISDQNEIRTLLTRPQDLKPSFGPSKLQIGNLFQQDLEETKKTIVSVDRCFALYDDIKTFILLEVGESLKNKIETAFQEARAELNGAISKLKNHITSLEEKISGVLDYIQEEKNSFPLVFEQHRHVIPLKCIERKFKHHPGGYYRQFRRLLELAVSSNNQIKIRQTEKRKLIEDMIETNDTDSVERNFTSPSLFPEIIPENTTQDQPTSDSLTEENENYNDFEKISPEQQEKWKEWKRRLGFTDEQIQGGLKRLGHWPKDDNERKKLLLGIERWKNQQIAKMVEESYY